ncbi:MAG TPA: TolC family protein [Candidatus Hydrogenedentes bacterium]|nr:TolC family protein [Candidatus Hydrogenedentota bacterium]
MTSKRNVSLLLASLLVFYSGCSTTGHRQRADAETYDIITEKSDAVPGAEPDFSIEPSKDFLDLSSLDVLAAADESLGTEIASEAGFAIINLEQAIQLATRQNRSYLNAKESLYLQALSLTLDRHRYTPIFSGGVDAALRRSASDQTAPSVFNEAMTGAGAVIGQLEQITGTEAELLRAYASVVEEAGAAAGLDQPRARLVEERRVTGGTTLGVDKLMRGGGRIAAALTTDFLRFLTGEPRAASGSTLSLALTQPLLRGAGADIAAERLTQAERDALYALRDYTHYRKEFAVNVCAAYYSVLEQRDIVRNNWRGLENFRMNVARERAFSEEGLRTQAELGRMVQAQLDNENRYINAVRRYQEELDSFKIMLGLSTDAQIVLDDGDLARLREQGLDHPAIASEDAVSVALAARLDLYNDRDRVADAERKVRVAANALKPQLDLVAGADVATKGDNSPERLDFNRMDWSAGFDFDPVFDKKAERNAYRAALIDLERAGRQAELAQDTVKLEVRAAWRNLEQARRNYEVALESVRLSERRVEEQQLLAELGEATAQDQVDAQNDLIQSQNNLTSAIISHTIARLGFWRDMGILFIRKDGLWQETPLPQAAKLEERRPADAAEPRDNF